MVFHELVQALQARGIANPNRSTIRYAILTGRVSALRADTGYTREAGSDQECQPISRRSRLASGVCRTHCTFPGVGRSK